MPMMSALLTICIAYRIHKTDVAVIATCYTVRDKVAPMGRPILNRVIRCKSPSRWVETLEKEMKW